MIELSVLLYAFKEAENIFKWFDGLGQRLHMTMSEILDLNPNSATHWLLLSTGLVFGSGF